MNVIKSTKHVSPHGWYIASYLLRFIELAEQGNDDPEKRFVTWENTVLIRANDLDEAYEKAVQVGMQATEPYKGGPGGVDVRWVFEGITEVLPIYEKLGDGAEIMWAKHAPRKLKNIRARSRKKGEFHE